MGRLSVSRKQVLAQKTGVCRQDVALTSRCIPRSVRVFLLARKCSSLEIELQARQMDGQMSMFEQTLGHTFACACYYICRLINFLATEIASRPTSTTLLQNTASNQTASVRWPYIGYSTQLVVQPHSFFELHPRRCNNFTGQLNVL